MNNRFSFFKLASLYVCLSLLLFGGAACRSIHSSSQITPNAASNEQANLSPTDAEQRQAEIEFERQQNLGNDESKIVVGKLPREFALDVPISNSLAARALAQSIDTILDEQKSSKRTGRWGVCVRSARDGRVLYRRESQELFTPASNMKVYTTAAALELLGAGYRWRTSLYTNGDTNANGIINGDLILYGRGAPDFSSSAVLDPTKESNSLNNLVELLYNKGVREVRGRIIADESYFSGDDHPAGWLLDDLQWYYGAEASALTINDNSALLTIASVERSAGDAPDVTTIPANMYVPVRNDATVIEAGKRASIGVTRGDDNGTLRVYGELPAGTRSFGVRVSLPQPALAAGYMLRDALNRRGIRVENVEVVRRDARSRDNNFNPLTARELAFSLSRSLADVVRVTNKESVNLNAELLLRTLGRERGRGKSADETKSSHNFNDTEAGLGVMRRWMINAGNAAENFVLRDGSGLSPLNLVTPEATVQLLAYMMQTANAQTFRDSLPRAGYDGTLRGRLGDTQGRVEAKTGALAQTNALSGYATNADGETLVFSIICNEENSPGRVTGTIDRIAKLLTEYSEMNLSVQENENRK